MKYFLTFLVGGMLGYALSIFAPITVSTFSSQQNPKAIRSNAIDEIINQQMQQSEIIQLLGKPSLVDVKDNNVTFIDYIPPQFCIESDTSKGVRIKVIDGKASSRSDVLYSKQ